MGGGGRQGAEPRGDTDGAQVGSGVTVVLWKMPQIYTCTSVTLSLGCSMACWRCDAFSWLVATQVRAMLLLAAWRFAGGWNGAISSVHGINTLRQP